MSYADEDDLEEIRPPSKKSYTWVWILLIIIAVTMGGGALACCGGLFFLGVNVASTEIENELRDNPTFREHIGDIEKFSMNFARSAAANKPDVWIYDVVGSKGSGELTVHHTSNFGGGEVIVSATLRLKDGTTVEIIKPGE